MALLWVEGFDRFGTSLNYKPQPNWVVSRKYIRPMKIPVCSSRQGRWAVTRCHAIRLCRVDETWIWSDNQRYGSARLCVAFWFWQFGWVLRPTDGRSNPRCEHPSGCVRIEITPATGTAYGTTSPASTCRRTRGTTLNSRSSAMRTAGTYELRWMAIRSCRDRQEHEDWLASLPRPFQAGGVLQHSNLR